VIAVILVSGTSSENSSVSYHGLTDVTIVRGM